MADTTEDKGTTLPRVERPAGRGVKAGEAEQEQPVRFILYRGRRLEWPDDYTGREFLLIQQETGIRAGELEEALAAGDVSALAMLVIVALRRAGDEETTVDDVLACRVGVEDELDFREEDPTDAADVAAPDDAVSPAEQKRKPQSSAGARGRRSTRGSTD